MMAKELVLLSKRKYDELLKSASEDKQDKPTGEIMENEHGEKPQISKPIEQVPNSDPAEMGRFVEKINDDASGTPGILDQPPKKMKRKNMKKNLKWILY